jgi:hypothetical protein
MAMVRTSLCELAVRFHAWGNKRRVGNPQTPYAKGRAGCEKSRLKVETAPSAAKAAHYLQYFTYDLKVAPFKNAGFFSLLKGTAFRPSMTAK